MYGFLFRKTIFDGWDHILGLFLANIGYLALLAAGALWWYLNAKGMLNILPAFLLIVVSIVLLSFYSMGTAAYVSNAADGLRKKQAVKGIAETVKKHIKHAFMHAFIVVVVTVNILLAMPFYMEMGGFAGPMLAFVGLFLSVFLIAGFKFFLPLCILRPEESVVDIVKYSFAYLLDNKGPSFVLLLRSAADLMLSVPFAGIIPGFAGILLSDTCALKILNNRYVLAEERNVDKTAVPWDEVLDPMGKQRYARRKFLSLLFPGR